MRERGMSPIVIFLLVVGIFSFTVSIIPMNVKGPILYVGGAGPGNYTTILSAVLSADPGDTVYVHNGTYAEQFEVTKPLTIIGEDRAATVIRGDGWTSTIKISSDWVNISGFTVTKSTSGPGSAAFELFVANHCNISNNIILDNQYGYNLVYADYTTISENVVSNGDYGVYSQHSHDLNITNNNISSNTYGIVLYNSGNSTTQSNDFWFNTDHGIYFSYNHDNVIEGNRISSSTDDGIHLYMSDRNVAKNNRVSNSGEAGLTLYLSNFNEVSFNDVSNNWWGISLWGTNNNTISNNIAFNCTVGILLERSINITLNENVMIGGGVHFSLENDRLEYWNSHDIHSNTVNDRPVEYMKNFNQDWGPYTPWISPFSDAGQVILANCSLMMIDHLDLSSVFTAVSIAYSTQIMIRDNNISDNYIGIVLIHSNENEIVNNTISSNELFGVLLGDSIENDIYHNSFINNGNQSSESFSSTVGNNNWDSGFPNGGNYWSDYIGTDEYGGANQSVPGSDGLGDVPYDIPGANDSDRFPLMKPLSLLPSRPQFLYVFPGDGRIELVWKPPMDDAGSEITNYRIYRGKASGEEVFLIQVGNVTAYVDTDVEAGRHYYYYVTAINAYGESLPSARSSATVYGPEDVGIDLLVFAFVISGISILVAIVAGAFLLSRKKKRERLRALEPQVLEQEDVVSERERDV
ncbi:MAG: right-handed parallel beta-helix repeat-containing protein [Thermoplasmata archaeon]|nr:right-handed parallel beta-helix repeat-containing protein [Thermoplasmata archaeon]